MVTLYIIRGLPGTGKSTLGRILAPEMSFAADDYFTVDGKYRFDPSKLLEAHGQCRSNVREALLEGQYAVAIGIALNFEVAVCNTFTCRWEFEPYIEMAKELGVRYFVISLFDNDTPIETLFERNVHGVPRHVFKSMYDRWET
jgi:tRNA uridine 5-carbamoylmethylation protein Kti12